MTLRWLCFDYSEDTQGIGIFEAMASTTPAHVAEVQAEIEAVIAWAEATFARGRGALEDGADWDCDVHALHEEDDRRQTLMLSIGGSAAFCEALRARFGL